MSNSHIFDRLLKDQLFRFAVSIHGTEEYCVQPTQSIANLSMLSFLNNALEETYVNPVIDLCHGQEQF
jgi:hypothetical protein